MQKQRLTTEQKRVINLMQNGWTLSFIHPTPAEKAHREITRAHLLKLVNNEFIKANMQTNTSYRIVKSLVRRGLIKTLPNDYPTVLKTKCELTFEGKMF